MKKQNSNQNVKVEKMMVSVKTFDLIITIAITSLILVTFQPPYKTVKEFETEICIKI